jgi:DNA phosphorothioation-dependent restriction protein DptG
LSLKEKKEEEKSKLLFLTKSNCLLVQRWHITTLDNKDIEFNAKKLEEIFQEIKNANSSTLTSQSIRKQQPPLAFR